MIEGDDVISKLQTMDFDLKAKSKKESEQFLINNYVTFNQVFNLISKASSKLISDIKT